jgi:pSer/pThr/pTyr-binding forkhead associated (FHA) protein
MPEIHLVPREAADQQRSDEARTIAISRLPCVIGRASWCDHRINDPMISRRHCALSFRDGQVWVEDLASRNGTRLNGNPVLAPRPVEHGAVLQLAHYGFVVRLEYFPSESHQSSEGLVGARTGEIDPFRG